MVDNISPASWTPNDVLSWATRAGLASDTVQALLQNQVDGPTLVTLSKAELETELGIASLPARRYLWDLIKSLRAEQESNDYSAAIHAHEEEIQSFSTAEATSGGPDAASGWNTSGASFQTVVDELLSDAQRQRKVVEDHLFAHRMQRAIKCGQQVYEDAEAARQEQARLNQLLTQAESDRQYAESLATGRERVAVARRQREAQQEAAGAIGVIPGEADNAIGNRFTSLFGLAVQTCVTNKINVAEAFKTGKVKPITIPTVSDDEDEREDEDRKPAAVVNGLEYLPFIKQCNVCYEEKLKGYTLACGHRQCTHCTRKLLKAALRDNTLLPLRCCEIPIDMNISNQLLNRDEATAILKRVEELEATNKMYCPTCGAFLNLDLVDSSMSTDLICGCGTALCTACKTATHQGLTCLENQAAKTGSDDLIMELASQQNWKQCPSCSMMIELRSGCNHMTCAFCRHEFCYNCLRQWSTKSGQCSSGRCELWEEDRLLEAGEARVQQEEGAQGRAFPEVARQERLRRAVAGLRANEVCDHNWQRSNGYKGECPNCGYDMYCYGMVCRSDCGSTVCYTCAHHRIPQRGWR